MKELIYKGRRGLLAVLWQMEVHGVKFLTLNKRSGQWCIEPFTKMYWMKIEDIFEGKHDDFECKVHPDDVHLYKNDSIDDTLVLNEHGSRCMACT